MAEMLGTRLVDTNILSMWHRRDPRFEQYERHLFGYDLAISFITLGELFAGAVKANWDHKKRSRLHLHLESYTVIHSDEPICEWYGTVRHQRRSKPTSTNDSWIAATALSYGLELVTHNPRDFRDIPGLTVITESW